MRAFKDAAGRTWEIAIDVGTVKRVRGLLEIDLYGLVADQGKGLGELLGDPCRLVDLVYVLVKTQADAAGISDEAFGQGFAGDSLEAAGEAFIEALVDFFPNKQGRETLRKVLAKGRDLGLVLLERTEERLRGIDLQKEADLVEWKLSGSSGKAPGASG